MTFLGIDIGTSGCKLAVFSESGGLLCSVTENYPTYYPAPGHAEQDADEWWNAVIRGLKRLWDLGTDQSRIAAISVAGQSWSAVPVESNGRVLARTPIWMDTRASETCKAWAERLTPKKIFAVSGNPFSPSYTLPKILHWMQTAPSLIDSSRYILQSNSFIVFRLTNNAVIDRSMAYGFSNFDQKTLSYDSELTRAFNIPERFLLNPIRCEEIAGHVSADAARLTGLIEGTPVVAGGLDAACSTFGVGVTKEGQTQEQGGQAGGMSICVKEALSHEKLILGAHVVPGRWLLQGGSVGGGASLNWFARELGAAEDEGSALLREGKGVFACLDNEAEASAPGANGIVFLPYFAGERSPIWDSDAKGMYFGLRFSSTHRDLVRATMEGVAYSLRHNIETAADAGARVSELRSAGGCANSHIWTQIKADITGLKMLVPDSDMATTLGAAMLAMVGMGVYKDHHAAAEAIVELRREQRPNAAIKPLYDKYYGIFKELYDKTADCMKML